MGEQRQMQLAFYAAVRNYFPIGEFETFWLETLDNQHTIQNDMLCTILALFTNSALIVADNYQRWECLSANIV